MSLHALLLLSDSALPLGSFAFSSGLESFLGHRKQPTTQQRTKAFNLFLDQSLANLASTALPYVLSAYHDPTYASLQTLDNDIDASTPCTVARRASITQGKALLTIWERALAGAVQQPDPDQPQTKAAAATAISAFAKAAKTSKPEPSASSSSSSSFAHLNLQDINGHFPPLFGAVAFALGLSERETCYLFLLNHAKAVLSAAVRASVLGPYASQATLASGGLQTHINALIAKSAHLRAADAAVCVPAMDLWMGRHELLYSRIFNS